MFWRILVNHHSVLIIQASICADFMEYPIHMAPPSTALSETPWMADIDLPRIRLSWIVSLVGCFTCTMDEFVVHLWTFMHIITYESSHFDIQIFQTKHERVNLWVKHRHGSSFVYIYTYNSMDSEEEMYHRLPPSSQLVIVSSFAIVTSRSIYLMPNCGIYRSSTVRCARHTFRIQRAGICIAIV